MLNFSKLPQELQAPAHAWVMHAVMPVCDAKNAPGQTLLYFLVHGDLKATARACVGTQYDFLSLIRWFNEEAPGNCWGSKSDIEFWKESYEEIVGTPVACDTCGTMAVHIATSPITLGGFIKQLGEIGLRSPKAKVMFDTGDKPGKFSSYRGDYTKLALEMDGAEMPTVEDLLAAAGLCIGREFEGYKGGTYTMKESTELYAANWGETGREVAIVIKRGIQVVIVTKEYE